ncbi:uncharacterized protein MKS88_000271 [Plasmodium brasilianum]|uniref:uncharacterized protein n=1 Tax=Plasmodium brasilianum TaxID=5824 RepID=UPI00350E4B9C|nr:hypothetical protein MKS88_000271 [Plasmodium brasilianum]
MEKSIKVIFFTKLFMFILSNYICYFYNDMGSFNKILYEKHGFGRELDIRIYRLLGIYIGDIYPYVADLELKIPYYKKKEHEKLITTDNKKWDKEKKEKLYRSKLIKEKLIKQLMKNKCTIFHSSYNHYEKKIMKGLDDKEFFKKMMLINDKDYKKLKRKNYRLRLSFLLLLFLLVLILPILDLSLGKFESTGKLLHVLCGIFGYNEQTTSGGQAPTGILDTFLSSTCKANNYVGFKIFSILIYCLPIIILGIMIIRGIFYYYKNVIKQKKIKFLEAFNEW